MKKPGMRGNTDASTTRNPKVLCTRKSLVSTPFCSGGPMAHHFESALGFFVRSRDFRLYLGGSLFHFWREAHVAVVLHAGAGRDEASDNDVFFQAAQVINLAVDAGFGEHARGLLERCRRDE